jgi:hypothetical protein
LLQPFPHSFQLLTPAEQCLVSCRSADAKQQWLQFLARTVTGAWIGVSFLLCPSAM